MLLGAAGAVPAGRSPSLGHRIPARAQRERRALGPGRRRQIARSHHERWDGCGYPDGLKGDQIPLAARICAICDVFDAPLSPRPYKSAWPLHDVIRELGSLRGTHLDPALVDAFLPLATDLYDECFAPHEAPASAQADAAA